MSKIGTLFLILKLNEMIYDILPHLYEGTYTILGKIVLEFSL